jgi:hypothetical protein
MSRSLNKEPIDTENLSRNINISKMGRVSSDGVDRRETKLNYIGALKDQNSPEMCWSRGGGLLTGLCVPSLL